MEGNLELVTTIHTHLLFQPALLYPHRLSLRVKAKFLVCCGQQGRVKHESWVLEFTNNVYVAGNYVIFYILFLCYINAFVLSRAIKLGKVTVSRGDYRWVLLAER